MLSACLLPSANMSYFSSHLFYILFRVLAHVNTQKLNDSWPFCTDKNTEYPIVF